jgi:hypothetical protein
MAWWTQEQSGKNEFGELGEHSRRSYGDKEEDLVDIETSQERSVEKSQGDCGRDRVLDVSVQSISTEPSHEQHEQKGAFSHKRIVVTHGVETIARQRAIAEP